MINNHNAEVQKIMKVEIKNLPEKKSFEQGIRRAPDRGFRLSKDQTKIALRNALRYIPEEYHEELIPEFLEELTTRGRIYGYRFRPEGRIYGKPIDEYKGNCLAGKTATPGLIDAHTHLVYGGSRENEFAMKLNGMEYLEILEAGGGILSTLKATDAASFDELYDKTRDLLEHMLVHGVTSVEAKSGYGITLETELKELEVLEKLNKDFPTELITTFMAAHVIHEKYKDNPDEYVDIVIDMMPEVAKRNLAEFCDVFLAGSNRWNYKK